VLRLNPERAARRLAHWQAIAIAACEQCGRNRVPEIHAVIELEPWLARLRSAPAQDANRFVLALRADARPLPASCAGPVMLLSGPEGGLAAGEEETALGAGFEAVTLGPRVLRAETAPLVALSRLA